jgi:hypothetical protein
MDAMLTYQQQAVDRVGEISAAKEQRFCKPKAGSSILSTGTTPSLLFKSRITDFFGMQRVRLESLDGSHIRFAPA